MKRTIFLLTLLSIMTVLSTGMATSQGTVKQGPDQATVRDPEMEKDSLSNLEKARFYFNGRHAYKASLARCLETMAGDPTFSKMDEVLYIAGESSFRLSTGKGKQKPDENATQLKVDAREYFSKLLKDFPSSKFKKSAEEDLKTLETEK